MKTLFVIRNQNRHYLGRQGDWVDGSHRPAMFRTEHRDVALNELIELNIRDFGLRGELLECTADEAGYPVVEVLNPIERIAEPAVESAAAAEQA